MYHYIFYIYSYEGGKFLTDYMDRTCSTHGEKRTACMILVGNPEGKRPLGRQKWAQNNIKMDLSEIGWDERDWNSVAKDRGHWPGLGKTVMNNRLPKNIRIFLSS
jgi:hypothetical protein